MSDLPFFMRDFDAEAAAEASRLAAPAVMAPSEEEIEARISLAAKLAFEEGRAQGHEEGIREARGEAASRQAALLDELRAPLGQLLQDQAAHAAAIEAELGAFLVSLCEKVAPELQDMLGAQRLASEAKAIARRAQGSRKLELRVAPGNVAGIEAVLREALGDGDGMALRVIPDPALGSCAITARWHKGRSTHDHERLCRSVLETIKNNIPQAEPLGTGLTIGEK